MPQTSAYEDPLQERLMMLKGKGWHGCEMTGGVCGIFLAVEFDHLPTKVEMEKARRKIEATQNVEVSHAGPVTPGLG